MTRHTLSHADQLFHGNGQSAGHENGLRGLPMTPVAQINFGAPIAASATRIRTASAVAAAGAIVLNGTLALDGNFGRNVTIIGTNAADTTQIITVRGYDYLGNKMTEELTMNGTSSVVGDKAFASIESAEASAALAGNLSIGVGVKLGFPFVVRGGFDVQNSFVDGAADAGTIIAADATEATETTGDVRGTYTPSSAANGAKVYRAFIRSPGGPNQADVFGVAQFADF